MSHLTRDKKVVVFGRTGDGKSTVANALVTGGIETVEFESSNSSKGCTSEITKKSGRGWTVTDTIGLGESETGTITNLEARATLTEFLKKVKDEYSHIIFVQRANRVTVMDEMNWMLFTKIFEGAEQAFVVLFTAADEKWLEENRAKLPKYMENKKILTVDISPISNRRVTESRQKDIRKRSIQKLEADLITIFDERNNEYARPNIAEINDAQLEEKSSWLLQYIVDAIQKMFDPKMWVTVASKLASLIHVVGSIAKIASFVSRKTAAKGPHIR